MAKLENGPEIPFKQGKVVPGIDIPVLYQYVEQKGSMLQGEFEAVFFQRLTDFRGREWL